jgi:hypothetical protein
LTASSTVSTRAGPTAVEGLLHLDCFEAVLAPFLGVAELCSARAASSAWFTGTARPLVKALLAAERPGVVLRLGTSLAEEAPFPRRARGGGPAPPAAALSPAARRHLALRFLLPLCDDAPCRGLRTAAGNATIAPCASRIGGDWHPLQMYYKCRLKLTVAFHARFRAAAALQVAAEADARDQGEAVALLAAAACLYARLLDGPTSATSGGGGGGGGGGNDGGPSGERIICSAGVSVDLASRYIPSLAQRFALHAQLGQCLLMTAGNGGHGSNGGTANGGGGGNGNGEDYFSDVSGGGSSGGGVGGSSSSSGSGGGDRRLEDAARHLEAAMGLFAEDSGGEVPVAAAGAAAYNCACASSGLRRGPETLRWLSAAKALPGCPGRAHAEDDPGLAWARSQQPPELWRQAMDRWPVTGVD